MTLINKKDNLIFRLFENSCHPVRYKILDEKIWICAKDLALPLNISCITIRRKLQHIPNEWKGVQSVNTFPSGLQNLVFLSEEGAIWVIMKTRATYNSKIWHFQKWAIIEIKKALHEHHLSTITKYKTELDLHKQIDYKPDTTNYLSIEQRLINKYELGNLIEARNLAKKLGTIISKTYRKKYKKDSHIRYERIYNHYHGWVRIYPPELFDEWIDVLIDCQLEFFENLQAAEQRQEQQQIAADLRGESVYVTQRKITDYLNHS